MVIECNRTLEQARRDRAQGRLTGAVLVRVPMRRNAWQIQLAGGRGDAGMLLDVQTLEVQTFTSLDKAVAALEAIGFACEQLKPL